MKIFKQLKHVILKRIVIGITVIIALVGCGGSSGSSSSGSSSTSLQTPPLNITENPAGTTITVDESQTAGMMFESTDTELINNGTIIAEADEAGGMYSDIDGSKLTNNGTITANGSGSGAVIIDAANSTGINNGDITLNGYDSIGLGGSGTGTTFTNNGNIDVNIFADGMGVFGGSSIINSSTGVIDVENGGTGMFVEDADSTATNDGTINVTGNHDTDPTFGMIAENGATAVNTSTGVINVLNLGVAMYGSSLTNDGTITTEGSINGAGMWSNLADSTLTNNGTIEVNGDNGEGMILTPGDNGAGTNSTITNNGNITLNGFSVNGLDVEGIGNTAINRGTIDVNGSDNEISTGILVQFGAKGINSETGVINLNGSNCVGMEADGIGSTIENHGTINLSGTEVDASYLENGIDAPNPGEIINGRDSKGNIGMKIKNGARMVNKGNIIFKGN